MGVAKSGVGLKAGLAAAAVGAVALGKAIYNVGEEFDNASDTIRVGTGKTGKALKRLEDDFKNVVSSVPTDFESAADAIAELNTRLNITGKPLRERTKQFLELSRITDTDVTENIKSVTRAFGDWEVAAGKQGKQLDKFFRASQGSGASVAELAENVVKFGAPLRQIGMSLDEATAMFAAFEKAGVNTSTMLPGLKMAMKVALQEDKDPARFIKAAFKGIEDGSIKSSRALELFGTRAGGDMIEAVQQGRFHLEEFTKSLATGNETIRKAGQETMDTSENLQLLGNKIKVLVAPAAEWLYDAVGKLSKAFATMNFKPLLRDLGLTDREIKNLGEAFRRVMDFIGPLVKSTIDGIAKYLKGFVGVIKGVVRVISAVLSGDFKEAWEGVKDIFSNYGKAILGLLKALTAPMRGAAKLVGGAIGDGFDSAWSRITGIFKAGANAAIGVLNSMIRVFNGIPFIPDIGEVGVIGGAGGNGAGRDVNGKSIGRQRGGKMLGGAPSGDSIPAMLERGEYVLNRNAVKAIGTRTLDAVNFGAAPRFQEGGPVRLISGGDVWGAVKDVAGYTPPGLAFKGAKAAVNWAKGFPEVISAISDISGMAGRFPGWVDPSWFINAAIDWLKGKTQKQGRSGSIANAGPLQQFNHTYPKHTLYDTSGKARFSEALTARIASWAGLPGKLFGQIAHGESGFFPGIYGVDPGGASTGYGLWAITAPFNDSRVSKYGGYEQMLNPLKNAKVAKEIYDAQGIGAWYGTQYVTSQRGGRVGMQSGGLAKGSAGRTVAWAQNNLGVTEGSARHRRWVEQTGGVFDPWCAVFVSAAMKAAGIAPPSNPSYSGAFLSGWGGGTNIGRSMSKAIPGDIIVFDKGDGGITDHVGIYEGAGKYISGNMSNAVVEANVADYGTVVGIVRPKYPGATAATAKGGVRKQSKPRKPKFTGSAGGIAAPAGSNKPGKNEFGLGSAIAAPPYGRTRGVVRDIVGPAPVVASEAEIDNSAEERKQVEEEHTAALKEVAAEMKRQTDLAESTIATNGIAALTALGDILKGTLGGSVQQASALAGAGHIGSIGRF